MHEPTKHIPWSTFTIIHMHKPLPSSQATAVVGWTLLTTSTLPQEPKETGVIPSVVFLASAMATTKEFLCESAAAYVSLCLRSWGFVRASKITMRIIILHSAPLRPSKRQRGRMKDRRGKTAEEERAYARARERKAACIYMAKVHFCSLKWRVSVYQENTPRKGQLTLCVRGREKQSKRIKDETINNVSITESLLCLSSSCHPS